ncbi:MAG: hypothetical protein KatS3mg051_0297 [Anaerolineae bacterium]|nr:MAG: hypothetical protein KatS3mg051_0297 [Anaerolineae bacterium]
MFGGTLSASRLKIGVSNAQFFLPERRSAGGLIVLCGQCSVRGVQAQTQPRARMNRLTRAATRCVSTR